MTKQESEARKGITIEYDADKGFGDSIRVNGITIMECLGYDEFLKMKISDLMEYYREALEIDERSH